PARAVARRASAAGDAVLPPGLGDRAAGVLGGARRREGAGASHRGHPRPARAFPRCPPVTRREAADRRQGMLLLAPTAVALGALTVYPGAWVLWLSLQHRIPIFGVARFAGLDNFTFLSVDARFWSAAHTTAVFTVASVALEVVL